MVEKGFTNIIIISGHGTGCVSPRPATARFRDRQLHAKVTYGGAGDQVRHPVRKVDLADRLAEVARQKLAAEEGREEESNKVISAVIICVHKFCLVC